MVRHLVFLRRCNRPHGLRPTQTHGHGWPSTLTRNFRTVHGLEAAVAVAARCLGQVIHRMGIIRV